MTRDEIDALPDTLTLSLRKPVTVGEVKYDELTFREPTAGQLENVADLDDIKATIQLLALSAGVLPRVISALPARDFKRAAGFLDSFLQSAQRTGESV